MPRRQRRRQRSLGRAQMPATALEDVRVLDLSDESASLAGRILADLGAEVILVEPPAGAPHRSLAPFVDDIAGIERSYHHLYYNANKRSVVLDFDTDAGGERFRELVESADVIIVSGVPAVLESSGLGFEHLHAINPTLIC